MRHDILYLIFNLFIKRQQAVLAACRGSATVLNNKGLINRCAIFCYYMRMELNERFRGYFPVVVDLETGGFDSQNNPLLEIGCQFLHWEDDRLVPGESGLWQVEPFAGSVIEAASTKVTGIDVNDPNRMAMDEKSAMAEFFSDVRKAMKSAGCHRAIVVAHNAAFDLGFLMAACARLGIKRIPFHPFSTIDTASLGAVVYGHSVLAEVCRRAGIAFDSSMAHSASYDTERTALLFCQIVNRWPYDPSPWIDKEAITPLDV